jgi:phosphatidate cytidylyltransferase
MKQRMITAVLAAALFLPFVIWGNLPFLLFVYLLGTIGLYELIRMKKLPLKSFATVVAYFLLWALLLPADVLSESFFDKSQLIMIGVLLFLIYTVTSKNKFTFDDAGFMIMSVLYIGMGFYYLYMTREVSLMYIFYALFTIWATDSGAYFFGKSFGKRKLWPEISPNKTVEGFFGGIVCALVVSLLFFFVTSFEVPLGRLLVISVVISIFGQLGDLVQSAYKRHYGVKDSGSLLPGHGGILDRLDSLIFILPILHLLQLL